MLTTDYGGHSAGRYVSQLDMLGEATYGVLTVNADTKGIKTVRMMKGFMAR